jgi:dTDP-4-dehydrorhamnose 3,5-epimerase
MANFKRIDTSLNGMCLIETKKFGDNRGYFMETYHKKAFEEIGLYMDFVQDNQSKSAKGVLRGLHFQTQNAQGKLVRVLKGEVFDVGVDLRFGSPTYGKWEGFILSDENRRMLYVPEGFAHGFLVLSDGAEFTYKCTDFYNPEVEGGIIYSDKDIAIDWPCDGLELNLSEKDINLPSLKECNFEYKG